MPERSFWSIQWQDATVHCTMCARLRISWRLVGVTNTSVQNRRHLTINHSSTEIPFSHSRELGGVQKTRMFDLLLKIHPPTSQEARGLPSCNQTQQWNIHFEDFHGFSHFLKKHHMYFEDFPCHVWFLELHRFIKPTYRLVGAQGYLGSASLGPQQAAQGTPFLARWSAAQLQPQAEQKHILSLWRLEKIHGKRLGKWWS